MSTEREKFEEWFIGHTGWGPDDFPGDYVLDVCYEAWQASREALKAEEEGAWIACSERMPEENPEIEVLACFTGGDISTLYYSDGRWDDAYGICPIRQDVTHWQPLPAPPSQPHPIDTTAEPLAKGE